MRAIHSGESQRGVHMTTKSCRCCVFFLFLAVSSAVAQDEYSAELQEEIQELEREQENLKLRLLNSTRRLALLRETARIHSRIIALEEKLEELDDEEEIEQIEAELESLEIRGELNRGHLQAQEFRASIADLLVDLDREEQPKLHAEALRLQKVANSSEKYFEALEKAIKEEREEDVEAIEQEMEQVAEQFVRQREILRLRMELFWAEEEGEEEAIEELREELRELNSEPLEEPEDRAEPKGTRMVPGHQPLRLSDEQITSVADEHSFEDSILPRLRAACFECHNSESSSGELDLEALVKTKPLVKNRGKWRNIIQQLKVRSMPPADADQPSEDDRAVMAAWLTHAIDRFDYSTVAQPGFETARRLTHDEYNNTVRDLTGVDVRPADRFPADLAASSGFDNSANSLFLQPVTLERYLGAAEHIVETAYPDGRLKERGWPLLLKGNAPDEARTIVQRFAARAWRKPVSDADLKRLTGHYSRLTSAGHTPESALKAVLQVVLVSPRFLIRKEDLPTDRSEVFAVSDWELASRLSYFLWASMPDDRLFELAESGRLTEPAVLRAETERMLNDPRANSLGELFAGQWLRFSELDRVQRDQIDNPWATDSLVAAMAVESAGLFNSLVRENQSVERLLDADYTFVNAELAKHYGFPALRGDQFQRVSLKGTPRRGILGHGSVLAVTSFPGRTSPVVRGNWILTELLGTPPPPPPPNVSEFDERIADNERLTQKQKLEAHRRNPACYACHSQIDPLGFALEEFEWFGRHRPRRRGRPVDARGKLPEGAEFTGLAELSEVLVRERGDDLTEQICRKMLSYALGRQLQYYDESTVRKLIGSMNRDERRMRTLIHAIVASSAFQKKQLPSHDAP